MNRTLDPRGPMRAACPPGKAGLSRLASREIAIFNLGDRLLATDNSCPHQGGPLCDGIVTGSRSSVRCTVGK